MKRLNVNKTKKGKACEKAEPGTGINLPRALMVMMPQRHKVMSILDSPDEVMMCSSLVCNSSLFFL